MAEQKKCLKEEVQACEPQYNETSCSSGNDSDKAYAIDLISATTFLRSLASLSPTRPHRKKGSSQKAASWKKQSKETPLIGLPRMNFLNRSFEQPFGVIPNVQSGCNSKSHDCEGKIHPRSVQAIQPFFMANKKKNQSRAPLISHVTDAVITLKQFLKGRAAMKECHNGSDTVNGSSFANSIHVSKNRKQGMSYSLLLAANSEREELITKMLGISRKGLASPYNNLLMVSIKPVEENKRLRKQLNLKYHALYPWLHHTMTISKLRNLKHDLFSLIEKVPHLDPSTVALAWCYFEELLCYGLVHKGIRKQLAAACLLLAYKFNQDLDDDKLSRLIDAVQTLDRKDNLKAHDIFSVEFQVFAALGFDLQILFRKIEPHLTEFFALKNKTFEEQYGDRPFRVVDV